MSSNPIFSIIERDAYVELQTALMNGASVSDTDERGQTPLQHAACEGKLGCVRVLLAANVPVDQTSPDKLESPLMRAAINGHIAVARLLLECKADPNFVGTYNETPLYKAVLFCPKAQMSEMAGLLIDKGAKILPEIVDHAAKNSEIELLILFLEKGLDPRYKTRQGKTLYTLALSTESLFFLRVLAERGVDMYEGRDLPLHAAVLEGSAKVRQVLQMSGIEIDKQDLCGTTALVAATYAGRIDCAELLLEAGANPNIANRHKLTPLSAAIFRDQIAFARKLIKKGADINHGDQNGGWNALWKAALRGHVTFFEELLNQGANYTALDKEGYSLLAMIKSNRPPHKKRFCALIKAKDATAREYARKFIALKHYGHFINHSIAIPGISFSVFGGKSELFAKTFAKAIHAFSKQTNMLREKSANELTQALIFAADQRSHTAIQTLNRIRQGAFTIIFSGWQTHGTSCAFLQDRIFVANTGSSGKVSPVVMNLVGDADIEHLQARHYNPDLLDIPSLEQIRAGSTEIGSEREAYAYLMYNTLPKKLQFYKTDADETVAQLCNIQKQNGPICTKACIEAIVKCYLALKGELQVFVPLIDFTKQYVLHKYKALDDENRTV